ncbi:DUF3298 and DUF4163 domain-containing protein [Tissierella praeacuta]|uniref:DUF3298 and DUF4163 domain-containing protein n=1 Tax=Tissierella praeacuta TaxID=43131 RepID=UPI00333EBE88
MAENIFPIEIKTLKLEMNRLEIYYPQVYGLEDIYVEDMINNSILEAIYNQIVQQGYYENPEMQISGTWELKNNDKGILSLTLINYEFSGGAHGLTLVKGLTFDIKTGRLYELKDLFKPGSDYVKVLSEEVEEQIEDRKIQTLGEFKGIRPNQDFYISDLSLTIFFQEYEIAPYVYGILYFPISIYEIQDIIDENGPLGIMIS